MSVETNIFDTLKGLVSNRCYPVKAPDNPVAPYIVYSIVTRTHENSLKGPSNLSRARVQIDCHAETYAAVKSLAGQIRAAMTASSFKPILLLDMDWMENDATVSTYLYRVTLEYAIWANE